MAAGSSSMNLDYTREDVDYDSTNEDDEETRNAKRARRDLADKPRTDRKSKAKVTFIFEIDKIMLLLKSFIEIGSQFNIHQ